MLRMGLAGITALGPVHGFAPPTERLIGNSLPGWTGSPGNSRDRPAPHPRGQHSTGGNVGHNDGYSGADPSAPPIQPRHRSVLGAEQENWNRPGIIGFNDRLQVRDRHVYWDRGRQRFGSTPSVPGNPPNPHTDGPARPDLRSVNISVNPMIGSSNTRSQDDLSRPYTWLGQQDGTKVPVYGGVPGLYIPYGSRGGVPFAVVDPTNGQGGSVTISSGPPHGLHSDTIQSGKQIADRYKVTPQMRPARIDRPSNSRIAGQSFSQTVVPQGGTPGPAAPHSASLGPALSLRVGGRGWAGV